jgi:uridine kinase
MPAGLDGNPSPLVTEARTNVLDAVAARVSACSADRVMVGIDGRSGSGKSTFADELAAVVERSGRPVIRSTTDLFHRPRLDRMRRGPTSAEGYYLDSHQIDVIVDELLEPFRDGSPRVLVGAFDEPRDEAVRLVAPVPDQAVLVFDGLFVHRPELAGFWDTSVLLHADRRCDASWLAFLEADLPADPVARAALLDERLERARWPRYRRGWQAYAEAVGPLPSAIHIDNEDLATPSITRPGAR